MFYHFLQSLLWRRNNLTFLCRETWIRNNLVHLVSATPAWRLGGGVSTSEAERLELDSYGRVDVMPNGRFALTFCASPEKLHQTSVRCRGTGAITWSQSQPMCFHLSSRHNVSSIIPPRLRDRVHSAGPPSASFFFLSYKGEPDYKRKMLRLSDNYNVGLENNNVQSLVITWFFKWGGRGKDGVLMDPAGGSEHSGRLQIKRHFLFKVVNNKVMLFPSVSLETGSTHSIKEAASRPETTWVSTHNSTNTGQRRRRRWRKDGDKHCKSCDRIESVLNQQLSLSEGVAEQHFAQGPRTHSLVFSWQNAHEWHSMCVKILIY